MDKEQRNEAIRRLRLHGEGLRSIGDLFGISHQRVDQILNRAKENSRQETKRAIAKDKVSVPDVCDDCGEDRPLEAHHEDYDQPLDVTFLCVKCHRSTHSGAPKGPYGVREIKQNGSIDSIGGRIRARRIELRMTQKDLSDAMDTSPPQISYYESSDNEPNLSSIRRLADALCVSTDWLIFGGFEHLERDVYEAIGGTRDPA